MNTFLILFENTHQVLKAEMLLKTRLEQVTTIPTPEELSSDCGISLSITTKKCEKALLKILKKKDIVFEKILHED